MDDVVLIARIEAEQIALLQSCLVKNRAICDGAAASKCCAASLEGGCDALILIASNCGVLNSFLDKPVPSRILNYFALLPYFLQKTQHQHLISPIQSIQTIIARHPSKLFAILLVFLLKLAPQKRRYAFTIHTTVMVLWSKTCNRLVFQTFTTKRKTAICVGRLMVTHCLRLMCLSPIHLIPKITLKSSCNL